jgi:hypothetical protein
MAHYFFGSCALAISGLDDLSVVIGVGGAQAGAFAGGFVHAIKRVFPNTATS